MKGFAPLLWFSLLQRAHSFATLAPRRGRRAVRTFLPPPLRLRKPPVPADRCERETGDGAGDLLRKCGACVVAALIGTNLAVGGAAAAIPLPSSVVGAQVTFLDADLPSYGKVSDPIQGSKGVEVKEKEKEPPRTTAAARQESKSTSKGPTKQEPNIMSSFGSSNDSKFDLVDMDMPTYGDISTAKSKAK
mmetsp:Transcript_12475/g.27540  ORF Transcript_12475/g.27540 Transcript_12475/m.27540 type:complete len:190 (-) Transcript_12475:193-762(-)